MHKRLSIYIVKELFSPFILGLLVIVFIFLINFMIKAVDRIIGKGIGIMVILEYIGLNIAWILALAVPMAVLIAALMAYGRLAADNEMTALKAAGVSFYRMLIPGMLVSIVIAGFMIYFNNYVLPDFNHQARMLGTDIYRKRPDLNIEEGYFINDIPGYSLLVKAKDGKNLEDVTIYNNDNSRVQTTLTAKSGVLSVKGDRIVLDLKDGEIHELNVTNPEEYRRETFERYSVTIPVENMELERSTSRRRGDREMSASMMMQRVAEIDAKMIKTDEKINSHARKNFDVVFEEKNFDVDIVALIESGELSGGDSPSGDDLSNAIARSLQKTNRMIQMIRSEQNVKNSYTRQRNKYLVEIQKKFSIPFACITFMLVGAPLGAMVKKGSFVAGISLSLGFFLLYWTFLMAGEDLADRAYMSPFWAMWAPNAIVGVLGILLIIKTVRERQVFDLDVYTHKIRSLFSREQ